MDTEEATLYQNALCTAFCTVVRHTGRAPVHFLLSAPTLAVVTAVLRPLLVSPALVMGPPLFYGRPFVVDPTVPPGQIDAVDVQGGRVLVRVPMPPR